MDRSSQPIAVGSLDGRLTWVNAAFCELTGYSARELTSMTWARDLTPPEWRSVEQHKLEELQNSGKPVRYEKEYIRKNGSRVSIEILTHLVKLGEPEVQTYFAFVNDVTERKQIETALNESEKQFRLLFEQSPLSIQLLDATGKTLKINKSFEALWGVSAKDLDNYNILEDRQLRDLGLTDYLQQAFAGERVSLPIRQYDARDSVGKGFKRCVQSTAYPVKDESGQLRNVVLIHQDVTERVQSEEALQKAKEQAESASRVKSEFIDIAAHELKTPLTPLTLLVERAQLLLNKGEPFPASYLERMASQIRRLTRLVDDLLNVSRLERGDFTCNPVATDPVQLIRESIEQFREQFPDRTISFLTPQTARLLAIDPVRVQQAFSNLLDNALKYSPADTPVEISVEFEPTVLRVSVVDHGPGIPSDQRSSLFSRFHRTTSDATLRQPGLGLGLYITRRIIELHGGSISAECTRGEGCTFSFTIPAKEPEKEPSGAD